MTNDPDLREHFASLRREDAARTPGFTQVLQRARHASTRITGMLAAAACLMIAVAAVTVMRLVHDRAPAARHAAPWLADWRAPTDFLLNTPGRELLHTVPQFGDRSANGPSLPPELNNITPARRAGTENQT